MILFDGALWLLATLLPLLFIQPRLHRELQVLFLLFTRRTDIALLLFALLFFPGVVRFAKPDVCRFCAAATRCDGVIAAWLDRGLAGVLRPLRG